MKNKLHDHAKYTIMTTTIRSRLKVYDLDSKYTIIREKFTEIKKVSESEDRLLLV